MIHFRLLASLPDLSHAEQMQVEVFGVTERDLIPANELIVVPETGGAVIAAFLGDQADRAVGVLIGWGGYVVRPRIVSDFLAVRPEARNLGLAAEMKRLQAALALQGGFEEIVWTVDPLRAANARLNFGKLGAIARGYEIDRYGAGFASDLYGGLPTDRLHVAWEITTSRVLDRLLGHAVPPPPSRNDVEPYTPGSGQERAAVEIPADVDATVATAPHEALTWRLRLRETFMQAFAEGFAVTGFLPPASQESPALLLERYFQYSGKPAESSPPVRR